MRKERSCCFVRPIPQDKFVLTSESSASSDSFSVWLCAWCAVVLDVVLQAQHACCGMLCLCVRVLPVCACVCVLCCLHAELRVRSCYSMAGTFSYASLLHLGLLQSRRGCSLSLALQIGSVLSMNNHQHHLMLYEKPCLSDTQCTR